MRHGIVSRLVMVAALTAVAGLSACDDEAQDHGTVEDTAGSPAPTTDAATDDSTAGSEQAARTALTHYLSLLAHGDERACDLETRRFRRTTNHIYQRTAPSPAPADCPARVTYIERGQSYLRFSYRDTTIETTTASADRVTFEVTYDQPGPRPGTWTMVDVNGEWLVADPRGEEPRDPGGG